MPPDEPSQSPFASTDPSKTPLIPPERREPPESPRLGILHLMVLTACVAVSMGIVRARMLGPGPDFPDPASSLMIAVSYTHYGMGSGVALAGVILLLARRLRGLRFPVHPGEYVLVITAVHVVLAVTLSLVIDLFALSRTPLIRLSVMFPPTIFVINAALLVWALMRVKRRRWRVFLLSIPVCHVVGYGLMWVTARVAGPGQLFLVKGAAPLAIGVVLSVVVIQDHLSGRRYPWSHWMGIALRLWFDFVWLVPLLCVILN